MSVTEYSEVLERRVRKGDWQDQLVPSYVKIEEAIEKGRRADALEYIDFFDAEIAHAYAFVYKKWIDDVGRFLLDKGMSEIDLRGVRDDLALLVNQRFEEDTPYDRDGEMRKYARLRARLVRHLNAPKEVALATLQEMVVQWRNVHDRDLDYICGLLNAVHIRFGEESLEEMYRDYLLVDVFDRGFGRFDVAKGEWPAMLHSVIAFTMLGTRLHLSDLGRSEPTVRLSEYEDRVELTLAPCGSGGRVTAGDAFSGTASRAEAPYYYHFMEREHDFSWNKKGVCPYCVHCCLTYEKLPIERFGYPVMVLKPPSYPDDVSQCMLTIYRNPRDVPEWAYERLGEKKPAPDEPLGSARGGKD